MTQQKSAYFDVMKLPFYLGAEISKHPPSKCGLKALFFTKVWRDTPPLVLVSSNCRLRVTLAFIYAKRYKYFRYLYFTGVFIFYFYSLYFKTNICTFQSSHFQNRLIEENYQLDFFSYEYDATFCKPWKKQPIEMAFIRILPTVQSLYFYTFT